MQTSHSGLGQYSLKPESEFMEMERWQSLDIKVRSLGLILIEECALQGLNSGSCTANDSVKGKKLKEKQSHKPQAPMSISRLGLRFLSLSSPANRKQHRRAQIPN